MRGRGLRCWTVCHVLRWFQGCGARRLPVRRIKELRHTAALLLHEQGLSAREIVEMLGHSDVLITLNTHTHVVDDNRRVMRSRKAARNAC